MYMYCISASHSLLDVIKELKELCEDLTISNYQRDIVNEHAHEELKKYVEYKLKKNIHIFYANRLRFTPSPHPFPYCEKHNVNAYYVPSDRPYVVMCHGKPWYPKAYETLRHEIIHVLQHCNGNFKKMKLLFDDNLHEISNIFIEASDINLQGINDAYMDKEYNIKLEYEAFSLSKCLNPFNIMNLIDYFCELK